MKATPFVLIVPHQKLPNSIKNSYILYEFPRKNGQFLSMSHIFKYCDILAKDLSQ